MTRSGQSARRWSSGADIAAPIAQVLMETTWLYAWASVIATAFDVSSPGFVAMVLLFALGVWSGRLSGLVSWCHPYNPLILLPATLVALPFWLHAVLLPLDRWDLSSWSALLPERSSSAVGEFVSMGILALYLWGRGVWIGNWPPTTKMLGKWLIGGAAAYIALFSIVAADPDIGVAAIAGRLELLVLGYFVLGLSLLAIVHAKTLDGRLSAGQPTSLARGFALIIPMTVIAALGLWLSSDLAPIIRAILAPVASAITAAAHVFAKALLWIAHQLQMFLDWLSPSAPALLPQGLLKRPPVPLSADELSIFDQIIVLFVCALILGLVVVCLALLARRLFRYLRFLFRGVAVDSANMIAEERSSLLSRKLLRDQLRTLRAELLRRLRRRRKALAEWAATAISGRTRELEPADIRAIYRRLLGWAAERGYRRQPGTTPQELWRQIGADLPVASNAVALITRDYERARYGDMEVTGPALAASRAASEEVRQLTKKA